MQACIVSVLRTLRRSSLDALKASSSHALQPALATLLISYIPCENYLAEFTLFRENALQDHDTLLPRAIKHPLRFAIKFRFTKMRRKKFSND